MKQQQQEPAASVPTSSVKTDEEEESEKQRSTRWLSKGFEELLFALENKVDRDESEADFDAVIVGSGYGGAVAARELAMHRGDKTVCVLERGREYLPGMFPARMADLASHVRFTGAGKNSRPRGYREGLFDVRIGKDVSAVVANGVGGGSLINAGVMLMPHDDVFRDPAWPEALRDPDAIRKLRETGAALARRLGATRTVADAGSDPTPRKFQALARLQESASAVPITVALAAGIATDAGVALDKCVRCGDCATGCNHNAKASLDVTLLAEAKRHGCEIFSGATLLRIEKQLREGRAPLWKLRLVHTDEKLRRRQGEAFVLRAEHVVLAAGTFGSTEILMRSESEHLRFSPLLGQQFSSNGDVIAAVYGTGTRIDGVGDETRRPESIKPENRVGPTITGCIDLRASAGVAIQDLAVPGPLRRLMEEAVTTTEALHLLGEPDTEPHDPKSGSPHDPASVDAVRIRNTLVVAMMSRDGADGVLELKRGRSDDEGDGAISVHWPSLRKQPAFALQHRLLEKLLAESNLGGGRVLPNPVWQPLPSKLDYLLGSETGPMLTVHPLGGCPMGNAPVSGVVDQFGRVFDWSDPSGESHEGLAVLDGSIVPTSLGINPALTIASVVQRAIAQLRERWGFDSAPKNDPEELAPRPRFRTPQVIEEPRPTRIEIIERLSGTMPLFGQKEECHVELTMRFDPINVRQLMAAGARLDLKADHGRLRIFKHPPRTDKEPSDADALLVATVTGSLRAFEREASTSLQRRRRGAWAWFRNRGLRDSVLWLIDSFTGRTPTPKGDRGFWSEVKGRATSAWTLASRAGAVRLLNYEWTIRDVLGQNDPSLRQPWIGQMFKGVKRLTYSRRSNPWRQLSEVTLENFPGLARCAERPVLKLDTGYLARQQVPLLRIVGQQDQPGAFADLASLGLYLLRILLHVHVWSARLPDAPQPREIDRLPGRVSGLPAPAVKELAVATLPDGVPVTVRLTRYRFGEAQQRRALARSPDAAAALGTPVLLIHGYSASGTTFAHRAVRPNLAEALWNAGRDVWIVDLRSSAGMPHARHPWTFEDMAFADIPVAVDYVLTATGRPKLDVFAHCMGSAMLGMALLGRNPDQPLFATLREKLPSRIRSLVISQVPPAMVFTSGNTFRAYAMRYLKHYLPLGNWQFRPSAKPGMGEQMIDRLLATLPYPESEFDRENPLRTPWRRTSWVGTRHRIDALYGRVFGLNNMRDRVLEHIDDQFGPLSIETVSQVIHFARFKSIATHRGSNKLLSPHGLREHYGFPLMVLHGEDNGLVSVQTEERFRRFQKEAPSMQTPLIKTYRGLGHQDCLIGATSDLVFQDVIRFFEGESPPPASNAEQSKKISFKSQVPMFGVRLHAGNAGNRLEFSIGDDRGRDTPLFGVFVPVVQRDGRCLLADGGLSVEPNFEAFRSLATVSMPAPVDPADEGTRLTFDLDRTHLTQGADGLLVMLMYLRSARIDLQLPATLRTMNDAARRIFGALPREYRRQTMQSPAGGTTFSSTDLQSGIEKVLDEMTHSVVRTFRSTPAPLLRLSMLRPLPPRNSKQEPDLGSRFVLASCQYPGGMLDRTAPFVPDDALSGPSDASYLRLAKRLDDPCRVAPSFLLLAGDQVYVDATAGLFDPKILDERFDRAYENFLGARGPRSVLGRLPAYMLLDDHEIDDDWEPDPDHMHPQYDSSSVRRHVRSKEESEQLKRRGIDAFLRHQRDVGPSMPRTDRLWRAMRIDSLEFFLVDSRTERSARLAATALDADLLGPSQERALRAWLEHGSSKGPRFIVTGPMVLPRTLAVASGGTAAALRSDAWDGYPLALHRLLAQIWERGKDDVVFLSGDAHRGNVATIELTREGSDRKPVIAHSIHCPALYAPYPFANAIDEDFACCETFRFDSRFGPPAYRCSVKTWFPAPGDGFAVISVTTKPDGAARIDVEFDIDPRNAAKGETKHWFVI